MDENQEFNNQDMNNENFPNKQCNQEKEYSGGAYSNEEAKLIKKFIELRKEQKVKLEFESLKDYELPPRTQFSMLKKPAVSIKYPEITFNMASIRLFEGIQHVLPWTSSKRKRMVVAMCMEEEGSSIEWARKQQKDGAWVNKTVKSIEYVDKIYSFMNWNRNCRYKVLGRVTETEKGLCLLFDLSDAIMFDSQVKEYVVNEETGETKKLRTIYYPNEYKDRIGKSYDDYIAEQQMSLFESLDGYINQSYEDYTEENNEQNERQINNDTNG